MTVSLRLLGGLALTLALGAAAQAQTAVATTPPAGATNDQVVNMSEFQVQDTSPNSYIASETMTGSRINTKIVDLPYSIVNLTSEFFNDMGDVVLDENMTYIGGLTGVGIGGGFTLRGFSATSMLRDGFYRLGRYGLSNIDRVEIIRGPNAAIYGRSSPGGMINFISLSPRPQTEQAISIMQGSFDQYRDTLYLTGSLDHAQQTYYVVNLSQTGRSYPGEYDHIRNSELFGAVEHDFADGSHLKLSAEYFLQIQHAPQPAAPILSQTRAATPDNTATTTVIGYDWGLANYNPYGPNSELNRGSDTFELTYDKQLNDVWSTRFGAYRFMARRWDYNQNTGWGGITIPAPGASGTVTDTRGSLPSRGEIQEDGGGFQEDIAAHYFLFDHKIEAKTLLTVDLNDYYRWDPTWEYGPSTDPAIVSWNAAGSGRVVNLTPGMYRGRLDYLPQTPIAYFPNWYNTQELSLFSGAGNSITGGPALNGGTLTRRRTTSLGGNLRQQMMFLDGKVITYVGLRTDNVLFSQRDYTVAFPSVGFSNLPAGTGGANQPGGSVVRRYEHQNKPNVGFNAQIVDGLHVYGSYSTAYFVDQTSRPAVIAASTYAPFTAKGFDYGVKGSYFQERLNFTVGGFYSRQYNVVTTDIVEYAPGLYTDVPEQDGDQLVRGWETDLSYVAIPDLLTVGESFARIDSRYTYYGSKYTEIGGRSVNGVTPENGSAYVKFTPTGPLKGLEFIALTTYVSSTPTQAPNAGDTMTTVNGVSTLTAHTDAWKLRIPSYEIWNFGVIYHLPRQMGHWDQEIQFNLKNAFNKYYLKTTAAIGDSRGFLVQYTLRHY